MTDVDRLPIGLIDLLTNSIILRQTAPYIPAKSLVKLSSTSKVIRHAILSQPDAWRHLDLTTFAKAKIESSPIDVGGQSFRAERMDESLTEDEFYSGALLNIFNRLQERHILAWIHTLILDGLTVPANLVRDIISEDRFTVRILSLRDAKHLNHGRLQQILRYAVRPTRPEGTPKLKALYIFGAKDGPRALTTSSDASTRYASLGVMGSQGAQIGAEWNQRSSNSLASCLADEQTKWYSSSGNAIKRPLSGWADTMDMCKGLIYFDAVLCRGPRHDLTKVSSQEYLQPTIATIALGPNGCDTCGSCPEGPAIFGECLDSALPLLGPVPSHSSTLKTALRPEADQDGKFPKLIVRCEDCLRSRWCEQCNRFWCEECYKEPKSRVHLRTEMQQLELRDELQRAGWATLTSGPGSVSTKVFSKLCVEHCLVNEMMIGAGSNGMWG